MQLYDILQHLVPNVMDSQPKSPLSKTAPVPTHDANTVTEKGDVAHITLHDQVYTLRITQAKKLILTK